jgi:hypothetical protein
MPLLSTPMQTAAVRPALMPFVAVQIVAPTFTLRLLDGRGAVTFNSLTFVGEDATYGVLAKIEDFTDGGEDAAPRARFILNPRSLAALTDLASASNQGSPVMIWEGLIDTDTGLAVDSPALVFEGYYDQPAWNPKGLELEIDCGSVFDSFFENDEGSRMTDSHHQSIYPGETGFEYVFETEDRELPWGSSDKPRPVATPISMPKSRYFDARTS